MLAGIVWVFDRLSGRAGRRGMHLLMEHLTPAQRDQFTLTGYFDVTGGQTNNQYRIRNTRPMNVELLRQGRCVSRLCFEPQGALVQGDVLLAQKLALELFENDTLSRANYLPVQPARFQECW